MSEQNKIVVSVKNGTVWTQIFDKKGEIVSSFISDHELQALMKARNFLSANKKYCIVCKELDNYKECME